PRGRAPCPHRHPVGGPHRDGALRASPPPPPSPLRGRRRPPGPLTVRPRPHPTAARGWRRSASAADGSPEPPVAPHRGAGGGDPGGPAGLAEPLHGGRPPRG